MTPRQRFFVFGVAGMLAVAVLFVYVWPYIAPFVLAVMLAAVIDPPVGWLHRRFGIGRGVATVFVLVLSLTTICGAIVLIAANLIVEVENLRQLLPELGLQASRAVDIVLERLGGSLSPSFLRQLRAWTFNSTDWAALAEGGAKAIIASLRGVPHMLFVVVVSSLATFFISKDRHKLWQALLQSIPPEWHRSVVRFRDETLSGALGILGTQFTLIGLTAVASVIGLAAVGVPYAWALGVLAGLLDIAPFLGPGTIFIPVAAVFILQGQLLRGLIAVALCLLVVLARQLIEPYLFGARLGLHPVTTLLSLYIGVRALGVAGFVVGPLLLIIVKAFFVVMIEPGLSRP